MSLLEAVLYARPTTVLGLGPLATWGYRRHLATGETPRASYQAMRKVYGSASTSVWDAMVTKAAGEHAPLRLADDPRGLVHGRIDETCDALRADGFAILPDRLDLTACDELEAVARAGDCRLTEPISPDGPSRARFDPDAPLAVRYDLDEQDVVASLAAQRVLADESLLALAQRYLGAAPVQDLVAMWWSAAVGRGASSAAAQQFHFDLDRLRFLKFFVFLTDVDERTGPHVYVRGSHGPKPGQLRHDGRHSDASVEAAYPGAATPIVGERGTMLLADTIGLHKGLDLQEGHRLVFQVEWASSLFGAPFTRPAVRGAGPELVDIVRRFPWTFQRFDLRTA